MNSRFGLDGASISICIATCQRPGGLRRLLDGIAAQQFRKNPAPRIRVVVVDNAPDSGALHVCAALRDHFPYPLVYLHEPRRGITYARNAAVIHGRHDADFIVFVDDDEVPEPSWLDELLWVQRRFGAEVVAGPVLPHFAFDAPRWAVQGGFFERPRHPTGHRLLAAATNNVLAAGHLFHGLDEPFDHRYALTGGSDYDFFEGLARTGRRIVWADDAVVHEWIPESRATVSWVMRRQYRVAISHVERELKFEKSLSVRALRIVRGTGRALQGLLLLPVALVIGVQDGGVQLVRALRLVARGSGNLAGLLGWKYEEFRRIHSV
jgi:succinoglycan biosynthesis protein ExoM